VKNTKKTTISRGANTYSLDPSKKETTSGIFLSAGEISDDFDKVTWKELLEDYTNMRNGGAVESTTISILKYPIIGAGYTITHENKKVVDYLNWCFENLVDSFGDKDGFHEFINHLFLAIDYGCSFFEKVYKTGVYTPDGKITNIINRLSPFKLETIWEFHYDESMQFSGIRHERRQANKINSFVDIPIEKLFFYAHNAEFGDPRGRSELRPVRNLYKIKKEILLATARSQQRGAGIPEIKFTKAGVTDEEKKKAESVGRSIGNMKNGYVITDSNMELKLHGLTAIGSPEATLEFINRELFFNTLTEFMTSGIGQNGSRSATSEHKSSYESKCAAVMGSVEKRMNILIREMCDLSYLAPLAEYPKFKFNSLTQMDIVAAAASINSFYTSAVLTKQKGDESFIRGMFNLPEIDEDKIEIEKAKEEEQQEKEPVVPVKKAPEKTAEDEEPEEEKTVGQKDAVPGKKKMDSSPVAIKLSADEQSEFIKKMFDVEGKENMYLQFQRDAEEIINEVSKKYSFYIARQIDAGKPVEMKYDVELTNRLNKLYSEAFGTGDGDVTAEIERLMDGMEFANKATEPIKAASKSIGRFASRLLNNIKTVVEDMLDTDWNKAIGAAVDYVEKEKIFDGFKTDKRTLIEKTTDGYMDGRASAIGKYKDNIKLYFYNATLDKNLCDECAKFMGAVMTEEEAIMSDLQVSKGRVNFNCKGGGHRCRCNLIPYKLKKGVA
jgi:hypothetical protein